MLEQTAQSIEAGTEIRIYQEDDWFVLGHVTECCEETVTVDFDDHIVCYCKADLKPDWAFFQEYFYPTSEGRLIQDFRPKNH